MELGSTYCYKTSGRKGCLTEKSGTFQYIPLIKNLQWILQNKEVFNEVRRTLLCQFVCVYVYVHMCMCVVCMCTVFVCVYELQIIFCRYSNSERRYLAGTLIFVTVMCTKIIHSSVVIMMPYNLLYILMRLKWLILSGHTGDFTN